MKRILICVENLNCGGVERCLIELLNNIDYKKYEIDLLLFNEIGDLIENINEKVNISYIIPNSKYSNKLINKTYKAIKTRLYRKIPILVNYELIDKDYDIEIAYMHGYITKLISNINSSAKKIAWIHTDVEKCEIAKSTHLEKYLPKFNEIICVSEGVKQSIDKVYSNINHKTKVIYNIIDRDKIKKLATENIDYKFKKNTIIGVGRFYPIKRFDLLIKAQKLLKDEGLESNLILVGYGDLECEYKKLILDFDIEDRVDIVGFKDNPYPYIYNSDIFVLSSDHEGLPTVICEAMSLGKPIISTKCAGAIELIEENKYGILTSCGDEYELKERLKKIIQNDNLRKEMEIKSLEKSNIFEISVVLEKLEEVLGNHMTN